MLQFFVLALAACVCGFARPAPADDNWPNFHGPRHHNHSDSTGLPWEWSETKNVVWKTPIHDSGWSSPVVWDNQIWMTTATDDGKQSFAVCVDRESGKIAYDLKLFETEKPQDTRQYNTFASPTPVIEEGRVYVSFGSYGTACLDTHTGELLWKRTDLPCLHWRGPGASPIVFENLLIIHLDDYDYQYVVALDKITGKTVWKKDREVDYKTDNGDFKKAYSTPIVVDVDGQKQLISPTAKAALAYDPRTGEELWRIHHDGHSAASRAFFGCGLAFISTGSQKELFAVRPTGRGDVTDSHVAWRLRKGMPRSPTPLLIDGLIYFIDDDGVLSCVEAETGKVVFTSRIGGDFSASPLYADGRIYLFSHQGVTTVIAPEQKLHVLAKNALDGGFRASPAVSGKSLILRTETHLYRIEQND